MIKTTYNRICPSCCKRWAGDGPLSHPTEIEVKMVACKVCAVREAAKRVFGDGDTPEEKAAVMTLREWREQRELKRQERIALREAKKLERQQASGTLPEKPGAVKRRYTPRGSRNFRL